MIDLERRSNELYLWRIEILPEYQGRGIGTLLIGKLINTSSENGEDFILDVLTVNHRAYALYQRLGMTEIAKHGEDDIKIRMRHTHGKPRLCR
jgi:ribosomal protein S18 acetylase RimI-like enzyme